MKYPENKLLHTQKLDFTIYKIKPIAKSDKEDDEDYDGIVINDKLKISTYHDQSCCERVYAEWDVINQYPQLIGQMVRDLEIKEVTGMGFLLCFDDRIKILIPCHNEQYGAYDSNLTLIIEMDGKKEEIDITNCEKDDIL